MIPRAVDHQDLEKEGPTGLIFTTTKARVHNENESRILSLTSDDSREQTRNVLEALASDVGGDTDFTEWHQLQRWLEGQTAPGRGVP